MFIVYRYIHQFLRATISGVYYLRYLILLASLMASFASTDGDGSLTMDLSNESSSLSLSDKPLLTLHNDVHKIQNTTHNITMGISQEEKRYKKRRGKISKTIVKLT